MLGGGARRARARTTKQQQQRRRDRGGARARRGRRRAAHEGLVLARSCVQQRKRERVKHHTYLSRAPNCLSCTKAPACGCVLSYSFEEGEELSRRARAEQRKHGVEWSYSETDAVFLAEIVLKLKRLHGHLLAPGGVLVELGCGLGKVSFGAVMAHAFERVLGFEALPQLHEGAEALARRFVERCLPTLSAAERSARKELRIEVLCADFLLDDSWLMARAPASCVIFVFL